MALMSAQGVSVPGRLNDVSLDLKQGEVIGLVGPNGSGKSTLLQCLCGLMPFDGRVLLEGAEYGAIGANERARRLGFLPQSCQSAWSLTVRDVIALGRMPWGDEQSQVIESAAAQAGVTGWLSKRVDHLSGGQQARVWLARVIAGQPEVMLADEPVASLDVYHQLTVLDMLRSYAHQSNGVIVSLHDLGLAARFCDQICLLDSGGVRASGTPEEVLTVDNIRAVYHVDAHIDLTTTPPTIFAKHVSKTYET
jgi:iron complex transport system ATP-binding protein